MLRFIVIPKDVPLFDRDGTPVLDPSKSPPIHAIARFAERIDARLLDAPFATPVHSPDPNVPRHNWDTEAVMALSAVRKALLGKSAGDVVGIDDQHWERLKRSVMHPSPPGYPPLGALQVEGFFDAVLNAPTKNPKEESNK